MASKRALADWLACQRLTNAQLLGLCAKLGVQRPSETRKSALLAQLASDLANTPPKGADSVIAVDVGVKNMAMARYRWTSTSCVLEQCVKLDLNQSNLDFSPSNWSQLAKTFLLDEMLRPVDSEATDVTVLIERQRFRSGGASNVLETTLQANTLEAMLFMGIDMWNELLGQRKRRLRVASVAPSTMVNYWEGAAQRWGAANGHNTQGTKDLRMSIFAQVLNDSVPGNYKQNVAQVVASEPGFKLPPEVVDQLPLAAWRRAWAYKSASRRTYEVMALLNKYSQSRYQVDISRWGKPKGDDLADAALYGLHYWRCYQERIAVVKLAAEGRVLDLEGLENCQG